MPFEQGPIRPPSEARSLLLRFTRNCPWNRCSFCPIYQGQPFSRRSLAEIKADIDAVRAIIDELQGLAERLDGGDRIGSRTLERVHTNRRYSPHHRHLAQWLRHAEGTVFLQDANSLVLSTDVLVAALSYLKHRVPGIRRVTTYARSSTVARKSPAELAEIRQAGLDRLHIGLESGADPVLAFVHKGVTAAQHITAGRRVIAAGLTLSEYVMPGLGGVQWSRLHALETARVLNAIDPHFIRLRSLRVPPHSALYRELAAGRFTPLGDDDLVREIRLFIEALDGIRSTVRSDHIMNLLPEVDGTLPQDQHKMLGVMDRYLAMPEGERLLYRLGRRGGALQSLDDLDDPRIRGRLKQARCDLTTEAGKEIEEIITELGDQFI